jgi:transcription termination factor Rho
VRNCVLAPYDAGDTAVAQDIAWLISGNTFGCHLEVIIRC